MNLDEFQRGWVSGRPETVCGAGSTLKATKVQRRHLAHWVKTLDVKSIIDVGAGDLNWIKQVCWPHPISYRAFDLVPRSDEVEHFDIIHDIPPPADMVLCLWVLNHLSENHARMALANLLASRSGYLVYTWWPGMAPCLNLEPIDRALIKPSKKAELRLVRC
jgi:hypothetical protein